ncbi:MAG: acyl-ACP thioesterase [Spirochaetae bacterium HGW-Spirochaetae-7]|jgi:acyl-ACP thioesterase|nr:MAG: acyl-ACP thioesterase [Spirochaetae bacterium HGW-Spirochaetae-7]
MNETFEERFKVCTWDVDQSDRLTIAAACNYFQEAAGHHASVLGVGSEFMKANGIVWILSRMSAELGSRPGSGARLTVRTWPRGTDRLFAIRDYELRNEAGAVVGRGRSAWLIVDGASFRPRRPEAIAAGLPTNVGLEALPGGAQAIKAAKGLARTGDRAVAYSDLDSNGHMNNARYVQWIQDALDPDELAGASGIRLDLNYLVEMKIGSSAGIWSRRLDGPGIADGDGTAAGDWTSRWALEGRTPADLSTFRAELSLR